MMGSATRRFPLPPQWLLRKALAYIRGYWPGCKPGPPKDVAEPFRVEWATRASAASSYGQKRWTLGFRESPSSILQPRSKVKPGWYLPEA